MPCLLRYSSCEKKLFDMGKKEKQDFTNKYLWTSRYSYIFMNKKIMLKKSNCKENTGLRPTDQTLLYRFFLFLLIKRIPRKYTMCVDKCLATQWAVKQINLANAMGIIQQIERYVLGKIIPMWYRTYQKHIVYLRIYA